MLLTSKIRSPDLSRPGTESDDQTDRQTDRWGRIIIITITVCIFPHQRQNTKKVPTVLSCQPTADHPFDVDAKLLSGQLSVTSNYLHTCAHTEELRLVKKGADAGWKASDRSICFDAAVGCCESTLTAIRRSDGSEDAHRVPSCTRRTPASVRLGRRREGPWSSWQQAKTEQIQKHINILPHPKPLALSPRCSAAQK